MDLVAVSERLSAEVAGGSGFLDTPSYFFIGRVIK